MRKALLFGLLLSVSSLPAFAETKCGPRARVVDVLRADGAYQVLVAVHDKEAIEMWSDLDEHWIAFVTNADGSACLLGQGDQIGFALPEDAARAAKTAKPQGKPTSATGTVDAP